MGKSGDRKVFRARGKPAYHAIARMNMFLHDIEEIRENMHNFSIPLYAHNGSNGDGQSLKSTIEAWQAGRLEFKKQSRILFPALAEIRIEV